jgi:quercetin dioxygenase-like cupin family protein
MSKYIFGFLGIALGLVLGQSANNFDRWWTAEKDATVAAAANHKILLENEEVRVLQVSVPPHSQEPMHAHRYPAVIYLMSSPHLFEHTEDGKVRDAGERPDGLTRWLPIDQAHFLENRTDKPLLALRVELKKAR